MNKILSLKLFISPYFYHLYSKCLLEKFIQTSLEYKKEEEMNM